MGAILVGQASPVLDILSEHYFFFNVKLGVLREIYGSDGGVGKILQLEGN